MLSYDLVAPYLPLLSQYVYSAGILGFSGAGQRIPESTRLSDSRTTTLHPARLCGGLEDIRTARRLPLTPVPDITCRNAVQQHAALRCRRRPCPL